MKIEDERIEFKENPNGVLNCGCFPIVRLANPLKNAMGSVKQIYLDGYWKGNARIVFVTTLTLDRLTPAISYLVRGEDAEAFRRRIRESFRRRPGIDWATQEVDFIILEYIKESREPRLF